jgi:uncharacterized phiE125 gp8 family phage protein
MGLIRAVSPTTEPLTIAEVKAHSRIDTDDDNTLLASLISAARLAAEARCQRSIAISRWELTLDAFPEAIDLVMPRARSIVAVNYRDTAGVDTVLDSAGYTLDNKSYVKNWLYPAAGYTWPVTWEHPNGVTVSYLAGFDDGAVPEDIKLWMKLAIGAWYDMRSGMDVAPLPMQAFELPPQFFSSLLEPWMVLSA